MVKYETTKSDEDEKRQELLEKIMVEEQWDRYSRHVAELRKRGQND